MGAKSSAAVYPFRWFPVVVESLYLPCVATQAHTHRNIVQDVYRDRDIRHIYIAWPSVGSLKIKKVLHGRLLANNKRMSHLQPQALSQEALTAFYSSLEDFRVFPRLKVTLRQRFSYL